MYKILTNIIYIIFVYITYSCVTINKIGDNFLLKKNNYIIKDKTYVSKKILKGINFDDYVKQRPISSTFGIFPLKYIAYNFLDNELEAVLDKYNNYNINKRDNKLLDSLLSASKLTNYNHKKIFLNKILYYLSDKPPYVDDELLNYSAKNINNLLKNKGYLNSSVSFINNKNYHNHTAQIDYHIKLGYPYYIKSYRDSINNNEILSIIKSMRTSYKPYIKNGDIYNLDNFEKERDLISNMLKEKGYYSFNKSGDDIFFVSDTLNKKSSMDVVLIINPKDASRYKYKSINIYTDSRFRDKLDLKNNIIKKTTNNSYNIFYMDKIDYKPSYYINDIPIKVGDYYSYSKEVQAKQNLFKKDNINLDFFSIRKFDDSSLDLDIYVSSKKKYDLNFFIDNYSSKYIDFALSPGVNFSARNIFGMGENFIYTFKSTLAHVNKNISMGKGFFNAYDISLDTKFTQPYFISSNKMFKNSKVETIYKVNSNIQKNIGLDKNSHIIGIDLNIIKNRYKHTLSLINIEFIKNYKKYMYYNIFKKDNYIKNNMKNMYSKYDHSYDTISDEELENNVIKDKIKYKYLTIEDIKILNEFKHMLNRKNIISENIFINSFIYNYVYNNDYYNKINEENNFCLNFRFECSGLFDIILNKILNKQLFINNNKFIKLDLDLKKKINLGNNNILAHRFLMGIVFPYSKNKNIPFNRTYSAGGGSDIRGWAPFSLNSDNYNNYKFNPFSFDNFKLLFNNEYRFNISENIDGAIFMDMGNIWGLNKKNNNTFLTKRNFFNKIAIGSGFGIRYKFGNFGKLVFDFGYKVKIPNNKAFEINKDFNILKPRVHFGINYPF